MLIGRAIITMESNVTCTLVLYSDNYLHAGTFK